MHYSPLQIVSMELRDRSKHLFLGSYRAAKWLYRILPTLLILTGFFTRDLHGQTTLQMGSTDLTILRTNRILAASKALAGPPGEAWYTGMQYDLPYRDALGTPFFFDQQRLEGRVIFSGRFSTGNEFLYDLVRDQLVVITYLEEGMEYIVLNRSWVEEAVLKVRGEEYLVVTEIHPLLKKYRLPGGYYELVYNSEQMLLLAEHSKELVFRAEQSDHHQYDYHRRLLLILGDRINDVTRERKLLALFPERKREIRAIRTSMGVKYEGTTSEQLRSILRFCEEIVPFSEEGS